MPERQLARVIFYDVSNNKKKTKKKTLTFLLFAMAIGHNDIANRRIDANKAVYSFQIITSVISKYWFKQFYKIPSSHFTPKTSKERHSMHTQYADTDVLQTLCADSTLSQGSQKVHAIKEHILHAFLMT